MLWQWGQFIDHDLDLSPENPEEPMPIVVPTGDEIFDPSSTGNAFLTFFRSLSRMGRKSKVRMQFNEVTSFMDASTVYGSDVVRARLLRQLNNQGLLKVSEGELMPFNLFGIKNAGGSHRRDLFFAGDDRANEQVGLAVMHTLFVREHNRKAREIAAHNPQLSDEEIYLLARDYVAALMQQITYYEFLPALLGPNAIKPYRGYNPRILPSIRTEFSTAAFRFGHSAVSSSILQVDDNGDQIGEVLLMDSFFKPELLSDYDSIGYILKGLASKRMQETDTKVINDLRNFLFIDVPNHPMLDLVALNLQRSRDHGLAM
jgi:hypothetical protein